MMDNNQLSLMWGLLKTLNELFHEAESDVQFNETLAKLDIFKCSVEDAYGRVDELLEEIHGK